MDNKRLQQLIFMFTKVTGQTDVDSRKIILETDTGKAVQDKEPIVMYEQQTENLYSIAQELKDTQYDVLSQMFTIESIVDAMKELNLYEQRKREHIIKGNIQIPSKCELKQDVKQKSKEILKTTMQIKYQNRENERRMKNADTIKR